MPPSRIAFALGDAINEIRRLLPVDTKSTVALCLDPVTFGRVERELITYIGGISSVVHDPAAKVPKFRGMETMRFNHLLIAKLPADSDG